LSELIWYRGHSAFLFLPFLFEKALFIFIFFDFSVDVKERILLNWFV